MNIVNKQKSLFTIGWFCFFCQAIHNLLVSLYVTEKPANLMPYLTARGSTGHWVDVKYLLKLCLGANLSEEAVYLYTILGTYARNLSPLSCQKN